MFVFQIYNSKVEGHFPSANRKITVNDWNVMVQPRVDRMQKRIFGGKKADFEKNANTIQNAFYNYQEEKLNVKFVSPALRERFTLNPSSDVKEKTVFFYNEFSNNETVRTEMEGHATLLLKAEKYLLKKYNYDAEQERENGKTSKQVIKECIALFEKDGIKIDIGSIGNPSDFQRQMVGISEKANKLFDANKITVSKAEIEDKVNQMLFFRSLRMAFYVKNLDPSVGVSLTTDGMLQLTTATNIELLSAMQIMFDMQIVMSHLRKNGMLGSLGKDAFNPAKNSETDDNRQIPDFIFFAQNKGAYDSYVGKGAYDNAAQLAYRLEKDYRENFGNISTPELFASTKISTGTPATDTAVKDLFWSTVEASEEKETDERDREVSKKHGKKTGSRTGGQGKTA